MRVLIASSSPLRVALAAGREQAHVWSTDVDKGEGAAPRRALCGATWDDVTPVQQDVTDPDPTMLAADLAHLCPGCVGGLAPLIGRHASVRLVPGHGERDQAGRFVVLVSCVAGKTQDAALAECLYTSTWFRFAREYAAACAEGWWILSAEYGLLAPTRVVAPYERTIKRMSAEARRNWAHGMCSTLASVTDPSRDVVILLAGVTYRSALAPLLEAAGYLCVCPLRGLRIGEQLHWLRQWKAAGEEVASNGQH